MLDFFSLATNLTNSFGKAASRGIGALSYLSGSKRALGLASSVAQDDKKPAEESFLSTIANFFGIGALLSPTFTAAAARGSVAGPAAVAPSFTPAYLPDFAPGM